MAGLVTIWILIMITTTSMRYATNNEQWEWVQMLVMVGGVAVLGVAGLIVS